MQRNGQKRDKKVDGKDDRKRFCFSQLFRPKVFDMDFPQKVFNGVFELPLLRNAQKTPLKKITQKNQKKEERYLPTPFSGHLPDVRRSQKKSLDAPWVKGQCQWLATAAGANKTRGAAIKNQLNTEIAACDKTKRTRTQTRPRCQPWCGAARKYEMNLKVVGFEL
jgi:hypothetical protein